MTPAQLDPVPPTARIGAGAPAWNVSRLPSKLAAPAPRLERPSEGRHE